MSSLQKLMDKDFRFLLAAGEVPGHRVVSKFGHNADVGTTFEPICEGGVWPMLQPAAATTLRIKAGGNVADDVAGAGARTVMIVMIDETGAEVEEAVATAGASASANTTTTAIRYVRSYVLTSGAYGTLSGNSHADTITIEDSSGTQDWGYIITDAFDFGQSEVGCYPIPLGYRGYLTQLSMEVDSGKTAEIIMFKRGNILQAAAPYSALRVQKRWVGLIGAYPEYYDIPEGPYNELTDIGFMARVSSTAASVSIDFEIVLQKLSLPVYV